MLNHITIMGRLARDPELRYTQSQIPVASFTVAVDRDFAGEGQQREADFIDCVAWRQGGEFVSKYFQKGSLIVVDGRLQSRKWTDKDGNKRVSWEILSDRTYFGGSKSGQGEAPATSAAPAKAPAGVNSYPGPEFHELDDEDDGSLPF